MLRIFRAYGRAARSLFLPGVLKHFLWPVFASLAAWVAVGLAFWGRLSHVLTGLLQRWPALHAHLPGGASGERYLAAGIHVALYFVSLPLMFMTAVLLLELAALPLILDEVARVEYPQLERRNGGSQWKSIRRTAVSFLAALATLALTLPLWLIPGFGALLSFALSSWLTYRSFSYDVLMNHADPAELQSLPARHRGKLLLLALGGGILTLLPVANLLAVPFAGLAFAHYLLRELQTAREG
jgi:CysZ protein